MNEESTFGIRAQVKLFMDVEACED